MESKEETNIPEPNGRFFFFRDETLVLIVVGQTLHIVYYKIRWGISTVHNRKSNDHKNWRNLYRILNAELHQNSYKSGIAISLPMTTACATREFCACVAAVFF